MAQFAVGVTAFARHARSVLCEEAHGFARFELMLQIFVGRAFQFDDKLVERVVIAASRLDGIPAQSLTDTAFNAPHFGLVLKLLLFVFVFQFQQLALFLDFQYA